MENRKKLHDYSICLIVLAIANLFTFFTTIVSSWIDGTIERTIAEKAEPALHTAVWICVIIIFVLMAAIVASDILIGIKGLKVSKNPDAKKGYITVSKVFFVLTVIGVVSSLTTLFDPTYGSATDKIVSLCNVTLDAIIYFLFIKTATAIRKDVLDGKM